MADPTEGAELGEGPRHPDAQVRALSAAATDLLATHPLGSAARKRRELSRQPQALSIPYFLS